MTSLNFDPDWPPLALPPVVVVPPLFPPRCQANASAPPSFLYHHFKITQVASLRNLFPLTEVHVPEYTINKYMYLYWNSYQSLVKQYMIILYGTSKSAQWSLFKNKNRSCYFDLNQTNLFISYVHLLHKSSKSYNQWFSVSYVVCLDLHLDGRQGTCPQFPLGSSYLLIFLLQQFLLLLVLFL